MSRLEWDKIGERLYETGVSKGVLYIPNAMGLYLNGYAWNGLTAVTASPSGAESNKQYADNIAYLNLISAEEFSGTIEAFTSPPEFDQCDGSVTVVPGLKVGQQARKSFGFSYQTLIGNDLEGTDHGYKIHLVYNALAAPSERANATVNESPEAMTLSWEFSTTPVPITPTITVHGVDLKPTTELTFSSTDFTPEQMTALADILYGTADAAPRLPSPYEAIMLMSGGSIPEIEVTPEAPIFDEFEDEVLIPTVTGVIYKIDGEIPVTNPYSYTDPIVVTAEPASGYKFPLGATTSWNSPT